MKPDTKIIWRFADDSVQITTPAEDMRADETESQYMERIKKRALEADPNLARAVMSGEISGDLHRNMDRAFRNAWVWTEDVPKIGVHMGKALAIKQDMLRAARAPKLAALDVAYMRADEAGDTKAKTSIAAQKQLLRDVTQHPDLLAAKTPEELKAVMPDCLKG